MWLAMLPARSPTRRMTSRRGGVDERHRSPGSQGSVPQEPVRCTPKAPPSAGSPDRPSLHPREQSSSMKNRKREICTSGTVRDEDGNVLIYSANDRGDRGNVGIIRSPIRASILPDRFRHSTDGSVGLNRNVIVGL